MLEPSASEVELAIEELKGTNRKVLMKSQKNLLKQALGQCA